MVGGQCHWAPFVCIRSSFKPFFFGSRDFSVFGWFAIPDKHLITVTFVASDYGGLSFSLMIVVGTVCLQIKQIKLLWLQRFLYLYWFICSSWHTSHYLRGIRLRWFVDWALSLSYLAPKVVFMVEPRTIDMKDGLPFSDGRKTVGAYQSMFASLM